MCLVLKLDTILYWRMPDVRRALFNSGSTSLRASPRAWTPRKLLMRVARQKNMAM